MKTCTPDLELREAVDARDAAETREREKAERARTGRSAGRREAFQSILADALLAPRAYIQGYSGGRGGE